MIFVFVLVTFAILVLVAGRSIRKEPALYAILFIIGLLASVPFEYPLISWGLWTHYPEPLIFGVSWFAVLSYVPFLGLSCWLGKNLYRKTKLNQHFLFFLSGALIGFIFDITATSLGYYTYHFSFPLAIGNVPLGITVAEGLAVAFAIFIAQQLSRRIKNPKTAG